MSSSFHFSHALFRSALAFCSLLLVSALPGSASAVVMTYTNFADFQAAAGSLMLEDFENDPWVDGSNPNGTTSLGLTWTAETDLFIETSISRSGARSISDGELPPNDFLEQINAELPAGTMAVGAFVDSFGGNHGVRMTASDFGDGLLASLDGPITPAGSFSAFLGVISSDTPIARISFVVTSDQITGNNLAVDDVYFGQAAAVPEPASMALFGIGLAALGLMRHRKMRHRKLI